MAVIITLSITQNSRNITNNTSNVTVKVTAKCTSGSYNALGTSSGSITIDGTKYSFSGIKYNTSAASSWTGVVMSKTVDVEHEDDGTKTLSCSASFVTKGNSGTVSCSGSQELTVIPRKSTLSVANGTLDTAQTLTVTRQASSFTHTIIAKCGTASTTICEKSTSTSISFKPPLSWASQNTTDTTVSVTYTITTYNGSTSVGSNSYTKTCAIPASVKPSVSVAVSDAMGYANTYGGYLKGLSKFKVVVTATSSYGSNIDSYKTTANGKTYEQSSFTTDVLTRSGALTVSTTVTDKRGRTGTDSEPLTVLDYALPNITTLTVHRCNADGSANDRGEYVKVVFGSSVTALSNKNTATYTLEYKKTSDSAYIPVSLTSYKNNYAVSNASYIFAADSGFSYNVRVTVADAFDSGFKATTASTGFTLMHWNAEGNAMGIGKIAEQPYTLDIALDARFNQPVYGNVMGLNKLPQIPENSDLNDYLETGSYAVYGNADAATIAHIPVPRAGRLEVSSATGEGIRVSEWSYIRQKFYPYNSENAVWERDITRNESNVWTYYDWWRSSLTPAASERVYAKAAMTIALSETTTLGVVNAYTKIPLDKVVLSTSSRLTLQDDSIRIGANIQYVKVSGQALVGIGNTDGLRHVRIRKISGGATTNVSWITAYGIASRQTIYPLTPVIVSVKEGDLIQMVFYTSNANDSNSSGSSGNGWQTYLTVEEL